jgi:hypothetical protein
VRVGLLSKRWLDATGRGAIRQRGADWAAALRDEQRRDSAVNQSRSDVSAGIIGARRAWTRIDDLGVIDPLELDAGDAEVAVAQLALDDDERHAFACQLDRVSVPQLVRSEPSANARCDGCVVQVGAGSGA